MNGMIRSFCQMLALLSRGDFAKELDKELTSVIDTLENLPGDSGKAKMTIEIEFNMELGRVDIKSNFKTKLPDTRKFMKTPFWAVEGALSVQHPSQADMFAQPRVVDGTRTDQQAG